MARYKVISDSGLNVRTAPSVSAQRVGLFPARAEFDETAQVRDSFGNVWHTLAATAGGCAMVDGNNVSNPAVLYAASFYNGMKLTERLDQPAPVPPAPSVPFLGVNCITDFGAAKDAVTIGAPAVLVMGQKLEAVWLARANPSVRVIYRSVKPNHNPSVDWMLNSLAPNPADPPIIFMGRNENDEGIGVSPDDLKARAAWDLELARRIKAIQPNATYIAGSFSMGTPALERDDVAEAVRAGYASAYNSGLLGFDFHLYAPNPGQIWKDEELIWYERRWEMLFTRCGFDPKIRNVWATETGVDQGSVGGFPAHNYTHDEFMKWLRRYTEIQSRPVVVGGVSYPSPHMGGVIFQYGAEPNWGGYDTRGYRPVYQQYWAK